MAALSIAPGLAAIYKTGKEDTHRCGTGRGRGEAVQGRIMCGMIDGDHRSWS